jgi:hypothetical protein
VLGYLGQYSDKYGLGRSGGREFYLHLTVHIGSVANPSSYTMSTGSSFHGGKAIGTCIHIHLVPKLRICETIHSASRCGVKLSSVNITSSKLYVNTETWFESSEFCIIFGVPRSFAIAFILFHLYFDVDFLQTQIYCV